MRKLRISKLFLICSAVGFCIVVFSGLMFFYRSGKKNVSREGSMEEQSNVFTFSFKEEQRILDKWFSENSDVLYRMDPMVVKRRKSGEYIQIPFYGEIERKLSLYVDGQEKCIIYAEVNIDNGIDEVVALVRKNSKWTRYYWTRDDAYHAATSLALVEYSRSIEGESLTLIEEIFSYNYRDNFLVRQYDRVLDASSTYIVLIDGTKTIRIATYGAAIYTIESVADRNIGADNDIDRHILDIKMSIDYALQVHD